MNRKAKTTLILAALVLIAGAAFFLVWKFLPDSSATPTETTAYAVTSYAAADVDSITVENSGEPYEILVGDNLFDVSIAAFADEIPVNQIALAAMADRIIALSVANPPLEPGAGNSLADYGLDQPRATLTINLKGGQKVRLLVGDRTATQDGVYVQIAGEAGKIYVADSAYENLIAIGAENYIDTTLAAVDINSGFTLSSLQITGSSRETAFGMTLKPLGTFGQSVYSYTLAGENGYDAADDKLKDKFFNYVSQLAAEKVYSLDVSAANLTRLGFDQPAYTVAFVDDEQPTTLDFAVLDAKNLLVIRKGTPVIYEIARAKVPFVDLTEEQVISGFITLNSIYGLTSLTINDGAQDYVFKLEADGENLTGVSLDGRSLDTDSFKKLYSRAAKIFIQGAAEPAAGQKLLARLTYNGRDGKQDVVEFYNIDGRKCLIRHNGESRFYALISDVENLLAGLHTYADGGKLTS